MVLHFRFLFLHFIGFLRHPNSQYYPSISKRQKLWNVCFYYLLISFVVSTVILRYPVEIAERVGLFEELKVREMKMNELVKMASIIILAPLIEEGVFRLWLGGYRNKNYFPWLYYSSAMIFGCIHIFNYQFSASHYLYVPFITMTQIFAGLMLGYIRIIYGFWYGVLLHASYNGLVSAGYFIFEYYS
jgi:uncharacterized protein